MSFIMRSFLILAVVVTLVSAESMPRPYGKYNRGRGMGRQRGRQFEIAEAAASPVAVENNAVIADALGAAVENTDVLAQPENLSAPEAAQVSEDLQQNIGEAIQVAAEQPQAQEVQPEIVAEKVVDTHDDLEKNLRLAKRHQKALKKYGATMSPEEAVEHHKALQKFLELALHNAEQHNIAVQEEKAIEAGAPPVEVAEIAPAIIAGRRMGGAKGRRG